MTNKSEPVRGPAHVEYRPQQDNAYKQDRKEAYSRGERGQVAEDGQEVHVKEKGGQLHVIRTTLVLALLFTLKHPQTRDPSSWYPSGPGDHALRST